MSIKLSKTESSLGECKRKEKELKEIEISALSQVRRLERRVLELNASLGKFLNSNILRKPLHLIYSVNPYI